MEGIYHGLPGAYIGFEGLNGSGKDTQINLLMDYFRGQFNGKEIVLVREPTDKVREVLLSGGKDGGDLTSEREMEIFRDDRVDLTQNVVRPALEEGKVVFSNRLWWSSVAFQGAGRELGLERVNQYNLDAIAPIVPDKVVYFMLNSDVANLRSNDSGGDKFERLDRDFHIRVSTAYKHMVQNNRDRTFVVNAYQSPEKVYRDLTDKLEPFLKEKIK